MHIAVRMGFFSPWNKNLKVLFILSPLCLHVSIVPVFRVAPLCVARSLSQGSANAAVLDVSQTGGHKKRVRRSSFLNAKKLYEDAQMARKVKQYLSKLSLETNEESLQTLSLQCEPSISTCEFDRAWLYFLCSSFSCARIAVVGVIRLLELKVASQSLKDPLQSSSLCANRVSLVPSDKAEKNTFNPLNSTDGSSLFILNSAWT